MPSPFSAKGIDRNPTSVSNGAVKVENSSLTCLFCWDEVTEGEYFEDKELLVFTCSKGHRNEERMRL